MCSECVLGVSSLSVYPGLGVTARVSPTVPGAQDVLSYVEPPRQLATRELMANLEQTGWTGAISGRCKLRLDQFRGCN